MKLIKIAQDHYIIVDDSGIQEGDMIYLLYGNTPSTKQGGIARCEFPDANNLGVLWKKITHSTRPESLGMGWMQSVLPLLLSEVKELIGEVDVFTVVEQWSKSKEKFVYQYWNKPSFIEGYNQALEDNKNKKYTEAQLIWAIQEAYGHGQNDEFDGVNKAEKSIIVITNYLHPKTEWEVDIINGKLTLKQ